MADPNNKTPRYLLPTTSQLLHEQESLRRRREYLEAEGAKRPVMRFGSDAPPVAKSYMPPPPTTSAGGRQTFQSAPPSAREQPREHSDVAHPPMRFSLTSYHAAPTPSARSRVSGSPTPRAVNTILSATTTSSRTSSKGAGRPAGVFMPHFDSFEREAESRGFKRQRSPSENDDPAQLLPAFPARHVEREPSSRKESKSRGESGVAVEGVADLSISVERETTPTAPDSHVEKAEDVVVEETEATEVDRRDKEIPVKHSPSGFPLPRASTGLTTHYDDAVTSQAVAPLPTPTRPSSSFTPLPVETTKTIDEFPTPTYAPRRSLFVSTPTPHRMVADPIDVPPVAEPESFKEEQYGSPAPTTEQVLDSFAASAEKRCCHRPARSATPNTTRAATCEDGADTVTAAVRTPPATVSPQPDRMDAEDTPSRRACGCARPERGTASEKRSVSASAKGVSAERAASPELTPKHVLASVVVSTEKRRDSARPLRATSPHTPSPAPTEGRVEQSILASAEKRVVSGSPTPVSRPGTTPDADGVVVAGVHDEPMVADTAMNAATEHAKSVSPQPTAEQLIDSLTMSARKPSQRSKATSNDAADFAHGSSPVVASDGVALGLAPPPDFASPASPGLTPQNIEESFSHCRPDNNNRSGAPDPTHGSPLAPHETHRSPSFDEAQVQASLEVIEEKLKNADRSVAEKRCSHLESEDGPVHPADEPHTHSGINEEDEADPQQRATFSHERGEDAEAEKEEDPADPITSDMFFDCHSAPATAPPTPALPEAYLQLQRDIQAISQGRSVSHSASPQPGTAGQGMPSPHAHSDKSSSPSSSAEAPFSDSVDDASLNSPARNSVDVTVRGSAVLLDGSPHRSVTPLARGAPIQQPHQPFDEEAAESRAEWEREQLRTTLSVSRTPVAGRSASPTAQQGAEHGLAARGHGTSPLPRPVTLRSQVRLPHATHATAPKSTASSLVRDPLPQPDSEPLNTSDIIATSEEPEEQQQQQQTRTIASLEQWRLNVDDDDQIFAISPSARVVVSVRHDRAEASPQPLSVDMAATPVSYKRSRSASDMAAHTTTAAPALPRVTQTPALVTADEDTDTTATESVPASDPFTQESRSSQGDARTSRGSRGSGGRKSQVEQLLEMLPPDVAEEIASSIDGELLTTPSSSERRSRGSARLSAIVSAEELSNAAPERDDSATPTARTSPSTKRARQEPRRSFSNLSLSEVQVSPMSVSSLPSAQKSSSAKKSRSDSGVTYSVVAGDVMAVSTSLSSPLQQQLFARDATAEKPAAAQGDVSPGTRKHLRHQKKMEKQRALKRAMREEAQKAGKAPITAARPEQTAATDFEAPRGSKVKKLKKKNKAKLSKKAETSPSSKKAVQKQTTDSKKKKKSKKTVKK